PVERAVGDGSALERPDLGLEGNQEQIYRLLRGGSWVNDPHDCRAASRNSLHPAYISSSVGFRPCCLLPPGSLLGS
ncbi:MAG: hypothetical protein RLZZ117_396, partial [Cyanobacteriota bacterium]